LLLYIIIGKYRTFVCGTLLPGIKLLFPETQFHIQKYDGLENIEKRSRALEVTLGSSTDPNLGHNPVQIKKNVWGKFSLRDSCHTFLTWFPQGKAHMLAQVFAPVSNFQLCASYSNLSDT
jgi:hypothetical protein